ncbi:MAG TPA: RNA polymerase sigma factor [Thermoanaerobaculia bacterium]|nr:RNA polymerase sigma factor [Thermoanaerobaculia bacterium]
MNSGPSSADLLRREDDPELRQVVAELRAGVRVETNSRRIFDRYYSWVWRYFRRLRYSAEDSEDMAQETFERVFRQLDSFREDGSFKSWLFAVAANLHRNENRWRHREKRNAPEVPLDAGDDEGAPLREPVASGISPAREIYERERREALARVVKSLPPQMGQVLALRTDQDLKYREIAAVLQISVETVKAHLFQARQRLRAELGEDFGEWME